MSDVTALIPVCLMLRVDTAGVQYSHKQALVTVEGTKLKYMHMKEQVSWTSVDQHVLDISDFRRTLTLRFCTS